MNRALFLDRDGVLDELVFYESSGEWESPRRLADLRMIDGVVAPLLRMADAGWLLFIVTNQPSAAKGKTSLEELREVHAAVVERLGVPIARSYQCFHHPDDRCECRKPSPHFLREAARDFDVDLAQSWMIGDQDSDLACGRAAGCRVALIENPHSANKRGAIEPDLRARDLGYIVRVILNRADGEGSRASAGDPSTSSG
jgi:D-glycero-D-manno-heptose 1,7-bisphosphate phosphatase